MLKRPLRRAFGAPGRYLCRLGYHRTSPRRGPISGKRSTFPITATRTDTLTYLECQRCGELYPGSLLLREWRRFP